MGLPFGSGVGLNTLSVYESARVFSIGKIGDGLSGFYEILALPVIVEKSFACHE